MKVQPLFDNVLVKRDETEQKTETGIVIPDAAREKAQEGVVVAVGAGRVLDSGALAPMCLKVGDRVLLPKYDSMEIEIDGVKHAIIDEGSIHATLS